MERIESVEQRLNTHILEDHQFQLQISEKLTEVSTKVAIFAGLPSFLLFCFEVLKFMQK